MVLTPFTSTAKSAQAPEEALVVKVTVFDPAVLACVPPMMLPRWSVVIEPRFLLKRCVPVV